MTPEQMVSNLRLHAAVGKTHRRELVDSHPMDLGPDDGPDLAVWEYCRCTLDGIPCGTTTCKVCDEPVTRHGSYWWHTHGRRDHVAVAS